MTAIMAMMALAAFPGVPVSKHGLVPKAMKPEDPETGQHWDDARARADRKRQLRAIEKRARKNGGRRM